MNWKTPWIPTAAIAGIWVATGLSGGSHVVPAQAQQSVMQAQAEQTDDLPVVLSTLSYLTDIAQNVAGDRLAIRTLIPLGIDPHGFEPTPADVRAVSDSDVLIINGGGFEEFLGNLLANAGGERVVISASEGLEMRIPGDQEITHEHSDEHGHDDHDDEHSDEHAHDDHDDEHSDEHAHDDHDDEHSDEHAHDDHDD
ncbi:MAG: metal ABC transporter substrate-binding protein, partial [Cyanophyceae cyanobacterium]